MEGVDTALAHIGRTAYHTYDNPYLRAVVGEGLSADELAVLAGLGNPCFSVGDWLATDTAQRLIGAITVGIVPRDVQLVIREEHERVAVESVHAFLRAPLFWWVISHLWCSSVGRVLDADLDPQVMGYRLSPRFAEDPTKSARMFRDSSTAYDKWRRSSGAMSSEFIGELLGTSTVDLQNFYYSTTAAPSEIIRVFDGDRARDWQTEQEQLTALLDALHRRYASEMERIRPRPSVSTGPAQPLPVGLPSSQILANLIMSVVIDDLRTQPNVVGVAAYADDLLVLSPEIPDIDDDANPVAYFIRLGIVEQIASGSARLVSPTAQQLALLTIGTDKSETSYSRVIVSGDGPNLVDASPDELEPLDPYISGEPSADWGGKLRTVLRSPHRRQRIPRELSRDIRRVTDDIRAGIEPEDVFPDVEKLLTQIDRGQFLALRPFWPSLLASAWYTDYGPGVDVLSKTFNSVIDRLVMSPDAGPVLADAIVTDLRDAWAQALAEAWATRAEVLDSRDLLSEELIVTATGASSEAVQRQARHLRRAGFVDAHLVSVPLAEFTSWRGELFGAEAFRSFMAAARDGELLAGIDLGLAKRFVGLHDACVAAHLWIAPGWAGWLEKTFTLLHSQPLVDPAMLSDLRRRSEEALRISTPLVERAQRVADYKLRIAVPSVEVSGEEQLAAVVTGDLVALSKTRREARRRVADIVRDGRRRHADVVVLPEWSTVTTQLSWLFLQAAAAQMLVVAGEAPSVSGTSYSNRIWTGIPLTDADAHRACLVPPPREKNYLSPEEGAAIRRNGLVQAPAQGEVPVYTWRGINFASLICFEFADIRAREQLRPYADLLTVSSWNKDWRYFGAAQEATTRDNYCVSLCVNTSQFPGTTLMRPTHSAKAIAASVHGSSEPTIVTRDIDLLPVVAARATGTRPSELDGLPDPRDGLGLRDYAALPPTFDA